MISETTTAVESEQKANAESTESLAKLESKLVRSVMGLVKRVRAQLALNQQPDIAIKNSVERPISLEACTQHGICYHIAITPVYETCFNQAQLAHISGTTLTVSRYRKTDNPPGLAQLISPTTLAPDTITVQISIHGFTSVFPAERNQALKPRKRLLLRRVFTPSRALSTNQVESIYILGRGTHGWEFSQSRKQLTTSALKLDSQKKVVVSPVKQDDFPKHDPVEFERYRFHSQKKLSETPSPNVFTQLRGLLIEASRAIVHTSTASTVKM